MILKFYITYVCDCMCSYCNVNKDNVYFDYEDYVTLFSLHKDITEVCFIGGEPTTHPAFLSFVQYNRAHDCKNILITNASSNIDKYIPYLDEVIVSLDGTREYNTNVRHYQNFDNALHFIQSCKDVNKQISINKVVTYQELLDESLLLNNIDFLNTLNVPINYILVNDKNFNISIINTFKKYKNLFNTHNKLCDIQKSNIYNIYYDFHLNMWTMRKCIVYKQESSAYNRDCHKCIHNKECLTCPKHDIFDTDLSCFRCVLTNSTKGG
jgi:molybdenum cofactor biosynthesis enzyme MoaA